METQTATSNFELFLKTPAGIEAALRVSVEDVDENGEPQPKLARLVGYMARLDKQLADANFQRSERLDKPARESRGGSSPTVTDANGEALVCPKCNGLKFYDNRADKAVGKRPNTAPDYKCKGCGEGIWGQK